MAQVIIYQQDNGYAAVVTPAGGLNIDQVALKDVPYGKPFKIVDESTLPTDSYDFFNAWVPDMSSPDGTALGSHRWFIEKYDQGTSDINAALEQTDSAIAALTEPEQDTEAHTEYQQQLQDFATRKAELILALADLVELRKIQTDELFKLEGVQL